MATMDGLITAPATTPAERMAEAIRQLRAVESEFHEAPEAFEALNPALTAAWERINLILRDARGGRRRTPFILPWVARAANERGQLRCAG